MTDRDRIRATYRFTSPRDADPEARARALAWEQTVELSPGSPAPGLREEVAGRVESCAHLPDEPSRPFRAVLSFPAEAAAGELAQLLNLLWGNASLQEGVVLEELELPSPLLDALPGPALGIEGIRAASGARGAEKERPLLCAALKPLGASARELARTACRFAEGGADLIKDDHSLADQAWASFAERVRACSEAVAEANGRTGGTSLYLPHVTGEPETIVERIGRAREAGCRGVLVNALPAGLPALSRIASWDEVFVLAHPSLAGGLLGRDHGIAPELLLGTLFRLAGADGVIYPNAGGRFPFGLDTCRAIHRRLREPLDGTRPAFPVLGGGIDVARIPRWVEAYGSDTIFLVGGSLYDQSDLTAATRRLVDALGA